MTIHRWTLIGLLGVAGLALWLLVAGPSQLFGVDTGNAGMVSAHKLEWATHFMIGNLLVLSLMWACLVEYAAKVVLYGRDRR